MKHEIKKIFSFFFLFFEKKLKTDIKSKLNKNIKYIFELYGINPENKDFIIK